MAPIAIAMPASDIIFAVTSRPNIGRNEMITAIEIVTIGTSALVRCNRKTMMIRLTTASSSIRVSFRVSIERSINSPRSYAVTILTPGGRFGSISLSLARTRSMTCSAFSPERIMTMALTVSPWPSSSAIPRRRSGPSTTLPRCLIKIGVPVCAFDPTTVFSTSATVLMYPRPRTMYSRPVNSTRRPPTSLLPCRIVSTTLSIGIL